jgi:PAS domain S-box-containing protein
MGDEDKTRQQLMDELAALRRRIAELEESGTQCENAREPAVESSRLLADYAVDVIYRLSIPRERYTYVSPSIERILGYTPDEILSMKPRDLLTPASYERQQKRLQKALEGRKIFSDNLELEVIHKDGSIVPVELRARLLYDNEGEPVEILGMLRDISERRRVEASLRRRNRELALFSRLGRSLVSTLDLDEVLEGLLEEMRVMLGIVASSVWLVEPETQLLVCRHATGPHSEVVRGWHLAWGEGLVGWAAQNAQSLIVGDAKADTRHFNGIDEETGLALRSILTVPLRVKDRVVGVIQAVDTTVDRFSAADLTLLEPLAAAAAIAVENARLYSEVRQELAERKRAESEREVALEALEESEGQFDLFMQYLPAAVSIKDVDGYVVYANERFTDAAGCDVDHLIGRTTESLLPEALHKQYVKENQRVLQGEMIVSESTMPGPEPTYWLTYKFPIYRKGRPAYVASVSFDISDRKIAEAQVTREAERAAALLRIADRLNSYLTVDELLAAICKESRRALAVPMARVLLSRPDPGDFVQARCTGMPEAMREALKPSSGDLYRRLSEDDMFVIPDALADRRLINYDVYAHYGIRTIVGMRIVYENELLGCLVIHTTDEIRRFDQEDIALLRGIADHAAHAIVTARLLNEQRRSRDRMEHLSQRLVEAHEIERRHLARELHDDVGQVLTSIKLNLQSLQSRELDRDSMEALRISVGAVDGAIEQLRRLSRDLRPSVLDDLGLVPALRSLVDRSTRHAPFEASFAADPFENRLPAALESAYFRIAQEALTNAMRHSKASHVSVELRARDGFAELRVCDDGCGFHLEETLVAVESGRSLGLVSMRERAHLVGATFEMRAEPGEGTEIRVRTPIDASRPEREAPKHR